MKKVVSQRGGGFTPDEDYKLSLATGIAHLRDAALAAATGRSADLPENGMNPAGADDVAAAGEITFRAATCFQERR